MTFLSRRQALCIFPSLGLLGACTAETETRTEPLRVPTPPPAPAKKDPTLAKLEEIERSLGGTLGVSLLDARSGHVLSHRGDQRFPMCSTFKLLVVAQTLHRIERGDESRLREISYGPGDLLEHAPVTKENVEKGGLSVEKLCEAAMLVSDNTAANLLLASLGGPKGLTEWLRSIGDPTTRLDRTEPTLNQAQLDDPRDTTTPQAMAKTMQKIFAGDVLSRSSGETLLEWMRACATGKDRLRKGLGTQARAGDKTGTGENGAVNDVAYVEGDTLPPMIITSYVLGGGASFEDRQAALAKVGEVALAWWTRGASAGPNPVALPSEK